MLLFKLCLTGCVVPSKQGGSCLKARRDSRAVEGHLSHEQETVSLCVICGVAICHLSISPSPDAVCFMRGALAISVVVDINVWVEGILADLMRNGHHQILTFLTSKTWGIITSWPVDVEEVGLLECGWKMMFGDVESDLLSF